MCTVALLLRPGHRWPIILGANRDEMLHRPWDPPAHHWPEQPDVLAGRDRPGGGTWMGINGHFLVAAVLNRVGSLGPAPDKRSRGELPLIALRRGDAARAAEAITSLDAGLYRTFNMVVADRHGAIFVRGLGESRPEAWPLSPGVHMVTAHDPDDLGSPRVARHLARLRMTKAPEPPDWGEWQAILSDSRGAPAEQINVEPRGGFGTVCSSLLALPDSGPPQWLFAPGAPDKTAFAALPIG